MKSARFCAAVAAVFWLSGCAEHGGFIDKRGALDEGLYYYEADLQGRNHPISEPGGSGKSGEAKVKGQERARSEPDETTLKGHKPTRVPRPALVDRDSTIHILVDPNRMAGKSGGTLQTEHLAELQKRKEAIQKVLKDLQDLIEVRKKAVELYETDDLNAFVAARRAYGTRMTQFDASLRSLWKRDTPEYRELNDAFDKPTYQKLQAFLMARIKELEEEDRRIESLMKARLSIEAFLDSRGNTSVPIHLDGYDSIEQRQLQTYDRLGLDLSAGEREALIAQVKATQAIATTANKARAGEISLEESLHKAIGLLYPRLNEVLSEVERLSKKIREKPVDERFDRTRKLMDQFVERVKKEQSALADQLGRRFNEMPATFITMYRQDNSDVLALMDKVIVLSNKWKAPTQADLPGLIDETSQVYSQFMHLNLEAAVQDANDSLEWTVKRMFGAAAKDAQTSLYNVLGSPEAGDLRKDLDTYYQDIKDAVAVVVKVQGILGIAEKPIAVGVQPPSLLQISLDEAKDTFVDLNYTPRKIGDTLTVRTTLFEDNDGNAVQTDQTTATFKIDEFGYFARLSCAVVLAKPTELEGGSDQFRFAPTLSWMHHYVPRPEEEGGFVAFLRTFRPSVGMHAAFLCFDAGESSEAIQVGLGATLAFWENKLQFGAGYNLMSESDDDGRYYFFVGTDLIGLLQTVGLTGSQGQIRSRPAPESGL